jgi:hypothetical protein
MQVLLPEGGKIVISKVGASGLASSRHCLTCLPASLASVLQMHVCLHFFRCCAAATARPVTRCPTAAAAAATAPTLPLSLHHRCCCRCYRTLPPAAWWCTATCTTSTAQMAPLQRCSSGKHAAHWLPAQRLAGGCQLRVAGCQRWLAGRACCHRTIAAHPCLHCLLLATEPPTARQVDLHLLTAPYCTAANVYCLQAAAGPHLGD